MPSLDGLDGSHYQFDHGDPDLTVTLAAGLWWIAWKVSQSIAYIDPTFATIRKQWAGFRFRGCYHWLSSTTDVAAQAAHFLHTIGTLRVGEFVMLDAEEKGITAAMCLRWCELIEAVTHRPVVIYTGLYVAGGTIWKSDALRMSQYGPRPFIVAAYVSEANLTARMVQIGALPKYPRQAWQFSSDGPVPGIVGRCDMDQVDDVPAFLLACAISDIPHPPMPEPTTGDDMANYIANFDAGAHGPAYPDPGCSLWLLRDDDGAKRLLDDFERAARGWGQPALQAKMNVVPCDDGTLAGIPDWVPSSGGGSGPLKVSLTGTATPV
jgi:hypothetical protein